MPPYKKLKTVTTEEKSENNISENFQGDYGADWREKCPSVSSKNYYALSRNILSDVTFLVGQAETVCHGHRLILALASPVFEAMFYGGLAEKGDTIAIPDVDPDAFKNLLRFLYSDKVHFRNDVEAFKTYFAADKYCITMLKKECERYLCHSDLTASSVWIYLESSLYLNSKAITDRCSYLLSKNIKSALQHSSFLDVNIKTIELLLAISNLNISELELIMNVVRWAENKVTLEQADSFQEILKPLLPYMRFGALTANDFVALRRTKLKEVLSDQDALAILEYIINPKVCALPEWCSVEKKRSQHSKKAPEHPSSFVYKGKQNICKYKCSSKEEVDTDISTASSSESTSSSDCSTSESEIIVE